MSAVAPAGGGGILGGLFGGFLANGGPASPGSAYMVGERGPEMFMPKPAGMVIPNGKLGGDGATQNVVINAPVTVNANGVDPAQNRDLANKVGRAVEMHEMPAREKLEIIAPVEWSHLMARRTLKHLPFRTPLRSMI